MNRLINPLSFWRVLPRVPLFLSLGFGLLSAATVAVLAAPLELDHVPGGVKMVVHIDAEAFRATALGTFLLEQVLKLDKDGEIQKMTAKLGFNPLQDFTGITMFADGIEPGNGVVLMHGAFDEQKLIQLALENDRYESFAHKTHTVHSWVEDRKKMYSFIHPEGKMIAMTDDKKQLFRAIDTLQGQQGQQGRQGEQGAAEPANLTLADDNAASIPLPKGGEFLFAGGAGFDKMRGLKAQAAILKQARSALVTVREAEGAIDGSVSLLANDADTAELMLEVVDTLMVFARTGAKTDKDAAAFMDALKTSVDGSTVQLKFHHDSETMIDMMKRRITAELEKAEKAKQDGE